MSIVFTPQLCQFISKEGGTGKSRIIVALTELFGRMGQSHRPLVTPQIAITNINKIVCQMKDDPDKYWQQRGATFEKLSALPGSEGKLLDWRLVQYFMTRYFWIERLFLKTREPISWMSKSPRLPPV
jgi:hypothetical protein